MQSFTQSLSHSRNREIRRENSLINELPMAQRLLTFVTVGLIVGLLSMESVHGQVFQDGQSAVEFGDKRTGKAKRGFSPRVGRQAAAKYMSPQRPDQKDEDGGGEDVAESKSESTSGARGPAGTSAEHYLALHGGWFVSDNSYKWGVPENQDNVGRWNLGVTYRMGEWINSMDLLIRFDVSRFALAEGGVTKFSFLPLITFPDASSRFPLYFGAGAGLGFFGTQLAGESSLALDYQLLAGARFFNLWDLTGLFIEGGIKNHLHLLSDGQYNGTFITTGLLFTF